MDVDTIVNDNAKENNSNGIYKVESYVPILWYCSVCAVRKNSSPIFSSASVFANHYKRVCHICSLEFTSTLTAQLHRKIHISSNARHICNLCEEKYTEKESFLNHKKEHRLYKCFGCKLTFKSHVSLCAHSSKSCRLTLSKMKSLYFGKKVPLVQCFTCGTRVEDVNGLYDHFAECHESLLSEMHRLGIGKQVLRNNIAHDRGNFTLGNERKASEMFMFKVDPSWVNQDKTNLSASTSPPPPPPETHLLNQIFDKDLLNAYMCYMRWKQSKNVLVLMNNYEDTMQKLCLEGNDRVLETRVTDDKYLYEKYKSQGLVLWSRSGDSSIILNNESHPVLTDVLNNLKGYHFLDPLTNRPYLPETCRRVSTIKTKTSLEQVFQCDICNLQFLNESSSLNHCFTYCHDCQWNLKTVTSFMEHFRNIHEKTSLTHVFQCPVCNLCFSSSLRLLCHVSRIHREWQQSEGVIPYELRMFQCSKVCQQPINAAEIFSHECKEWMDLELSMTLDDFEDQEAFSKWVQFPCPSKNESLAITRSQFCPICSSPYVKTNSIEELKSHLAQVHALIMELSQDIFTFSPRCEALEKQPNLEFEEDFDVLTPTLHSGLKVGSRVDFPDAAILDRIDKIGIRKYDFKSYCLQTIFHAKNCQKLEVQLPMSISYDEEAKKLICDLCTKDFKSLAHFKVRVESRKAHVDCIQINLKSNTPVKKEDASPTLAPETLYEDTEMSSEEETEAKVVSDEDSEIKAMSSEEETEVKVVSDKDTEIKVISSEEETEVKVVSNEDTEMKEENEVKVMSSQGTTVDANLSSRFAYNNFLVKDTTSNKENVGNKISEHLSDPRSLLKECSVKVTDVMNDKVLLKERSINISSFCQMYNNPSQSLSPPKPNKYIEFFRMNGDLLDLDSSYLQQFLLKKCQVKLRRLKRPDISCVRVYKARIPKFFLTENLIVLANGLTWGQISCENEPFDQPIPALPDASSSNYDPLTSKGPLLIGTTNTNWVEMDDHLGKDSESKSDPDPQSKPDSGPFVYIDNSANLEANEFVPFEGSSGSATSNEFTSVLNLDGSTDVVMFNDLAPSGGGLRVLEPHRLSPTLNVDGSADLESDDGCEGTSSESEDIDDKEEVKREFRDLDIKTESPDEDIGEENINSLETSADYMTLLREEILLSLFRKRKQRHPDALHANQPKAKRRKKVKVFVHMERKAVPLKLNDSGIEIGKVRSVTKAPSVNPECKDCGQVFQKTDNLTIHHILLHARSQCFECQELFESKELKDLHFRQDHSLMKDCGICHESFQKTALQVHLFKAHGLFHCQFCKYIISDKSIKIHLTETHRLKMKYLDENFQVHEDFRPFRYFKDNYVMCEYCGFQKMRPENVYKHLRFTHVFQQSKALEIMEEYDLIPSSSISKNLQQIEGDPQQRGENVVPMALQPDIKIEQPDLSASAPQEPLAVLPDLKLDVTEEEVPAPRTEEPEGAPKAEEETKTEPFYFIPIEEVDLDDESEYPAKTVKCNNCKKHFCDILGYRNHGCFVLDSRHICPFCQEEHKKLSYLRKHIKIKHKILFQDLDDHMARIPFQEPEGFPVHIKEEVPRFNRKKRKMNPQFCEKCGKHFPDTKHYHRHMCMMEPKSYRCPLCDETKTCIQYIRRHVKNKHKVTSADQLDADWLSKCSHCDAKFFSTFESKTHENQVHGATGDKRICSFCGFISTNTDSLIKHQRRMHPNDIGYTGNDANKCRFCPGEFRDRNLKLRHIMAAHPDEASEIIPCSICEYVGENRMHAKNHYRRFHKISYRPFKCNVCYIIFDDRDKMHDHQKSEHPTEFEKQDKERKTKFLEALKNRPERKLYKCEVCEKMCRSRGCLTTHMKSHKLKEVKEEEVSDLEDKLKGKNMKAKKTKKSGSSRKAVISKFKCKLCDQTFESQDLRKIHYDADHPDDPLYKCDKCDQGFRTKGSYHSHNSRHHDAKEYECEYCGKVYLARDTYKEHLLIHTGTRYRCPHCPKEFVQKSNLTRHVRIHLGIKPYKCGYCEKTFCDVGARNVHQTTHDPSSRKACPYCEKTFSQTSKLNNHMKLHTGKGLFECDQCGKVFHSAYNIKVHMASVHGVEKKPTRCYTCNQTFESCADLKRHFDSNHHDKELSCKRCGLMCRSHMHLNDHIFTFHCKNDKEGSSSSPTAMKGFSCLKCDYSTNSKSDMNEHLNQDHQIWENLAIHFADNFNSMSTISRLTAKNMIEVPQGEASLTIVQNPRVREESCVTCLHCHRSFKNSKSLRSHLSKLDEFLDMCPICNEELPSKLATHDHILEKHPGEQTGFELDSSIIQMNFNSISERNKKVIFNINNKCAHCLIDFGTKVALEIHLDDEALLGEVCELCGLQSKNVLENNEHMLREHFSDQQKIIKAEPLEYEYDATQEQDPLNLDLIGHEVGNEEDEITFSSDETKQIGEPICNLLETN